ncbi:MAG TPA: anti-repressor SinI family protein [Bacillota bacterium]|nr:anti-repressor SinI family protein [Bacillota bacterium]
MDNKESSHLDDEWIALIQVARNIGLSREEIRSFFREAESQT